MYIYYTRENDSKWLRSCQCVIENLPPWSSLATPLAAPSEGIGGGGCDCWYSRRAVTSIPASSVLLELVFAGSRLSCKLLMSHISWPDIPWRSTAGIDHKNPFGGHADLDVTLEAAK